MRFRRRPSSPLPAREPAKPARPPWQAHPDPQERPSRDDLAAKHDVFTDSILEPVPMPRWLRGRRRLPREKSS